MGCVATSNPARVAPVVDLPPEEVIFGTSAVMGAIRHKVERAANATSPSYSRGQAAPGREFSPDLSIAAPPWGTGLSSRSTALPFPAPWLRTSLSGTRK